MVSLDKTLHQFDPRYFGTISELRRAMTSPENQLLFITCCDHFDALANVSFARLDQLFIVQNMAASVPSPDDTSELSTLASIEYAVCGLEIGQIVVCGHLDCRIIRKLLSPRRSWLGKLKQDFNAESISIVEDNYVDMGGEELVEIMIREHILFQLENLELHDFIRERLEDEALKLHAWLVNDDTTQIQAYDPRRGDFVPTEESA